MFKIELESPLCALEVKCETEREAKAVFEQYRQSATFSNWLNLCRWDEEQQDWLEIDVCKLEEGGQLYPLYRVYIVDDRMEKSYYQYKDLESAVKQYRLWAMNKAWGVWFEHFDGRKWSLVSIAC